MLVHQLLAYDPNLQQAYLTNRFVDGLRGDIRVVVLVHRPKNLDTASSLALLQEDALQIHCKKEWKKPEAHNAGNLVSVITSRSMVKGGAQPLPLPHGTNTSKTPVGGLINQNTGSRKMEDKFSAIKAYRRANGLCYKSGDKWSPNNHTCSNSVPLHLVEEIWAIMNEEEDTEVLNSIDSENQMGSSQEHLMAISKQAIDGTETKKTIRLKGFLGNQEVIMLIDSGSSASFISDKVVSSVAPIQILAQQVKVKVADGGVLTCSKQVQNCPWYCQGQTFHTDFKILPLACYDVILGMD